MSENFCVARNTSVDYSVVGRGNAYRNEAIPSLLVLTRRSAAHLSRFVDVYRRRFQSGAISNQCIKVSREIRRGYVAMTSPLIAYRC